MYHIQCTERFYTVDNCVLLRLFACLFVCLFNEGNDLIEKKKFLLLNCCLNGSAVRKKIKEDNDTPPESVLLICSSIFAINTAINVTAHMEWTYIPFQRTVSKTKHI